MFGLKNDFDRLFQDFFTTSKFKTEVMEDNDFYVVKAFLPGVKKESIRVEYKNESLNIYVLEDDNDDTKEMPNMKSLNIPNIDMSKTKAKYFEGLLEVILPKKEIIDKSYLINIE